VTNNRGLILEDFRAAPEPRRLVRRLDSGLRLVTVPLPRARRVSLELLTRAGSRFDPEASHGISHFLEHMLYRGTRSYPGPHELSLSIENLGGTLDAATAIDHGSIGLSLPPENLAEALPILAEVVSSPILQGIDVERAIVREEILELLDEDGRLVDPDEVARQLVFGEHPLGRPITGSLETLERFDREGLEAFHAERYRAEQMVLAIAGPVNELALAEELAQLRWPTPGASPLPERPAPPQAEPRFTTVRHAESQTSVRVEFRAPGHLGGGEPKTELLLRVLDDGMSTRLYHRICNTLGLCYDVGAYYEAWEDLGIVEITAESAHDQTPRLVDELLGLLERLAAEGPTEEEYVRARRRLDWQLRELCDEPTELATMAAYGELFDVARDPMERRAEFEHVSLEELKAAARQLFSAERLSVVCVGELSRRSRAELERRVLGFGV
jgi:predicted Zn-dependent peptidase